ncbi:probable prefoldin subunit 5 [Teleopsis dalmanni]|uniref:probable prefoldin subunit 5 n=1 Tax=Teleopsis dalmanni TaxID=139649 RepID=UPI0018CDF8E4|nr:probable prefoldin subunit 5 [Teleopsis dalmanni]XP_037956435.1 probable prefoldin subunit 5 [Teleopsis dalmanni]
MTGVDVAKLEEIINECLKEELRQMDELLNRTNGELEEYFQLKNTLAAMKDEIAVGFKTQYNIGGNIFMQAKTNPTDKILVNVGAGIFLELSLEEAKYFAEQKINILTKNSDFIRKQTVIKRAQIKMALMIIGNEEKLHLESVD